MKFTDEELRIIFLLARIELLRDSYIGSPPYDTLLQKLNTHIDNYDEYWENNNVNTTTR